MSSTRTSIVLLVALSSAVPAGSALWSSYGELEPDYPPDVGQRFMWANSPTDGMKVYFNAVLTSGFALFGPNPSVALLGSRYHSQGDFVIPVAYLGVWRDCNLDGYIGTAETAQSEYPTAELEALELSQDFTSPCEPGSIFNKNGWVWEFIWIYDGNEGPEISQLARFVNDTSVKIWGDAARPGETLAGDCFINPAIGFFSSTGAMIDYADCLAGRVIVGGVNTVDGATGLGIGFYNPDAPDNPQCSDSPLNRNEAHLFQDAPECPEKSGTGLWEEDSGDQAFTSWDCGAPEAHNTTIARPVPEPIVVTNPASGQEIVRAFNNSEITILAVPAPAVEVKNARGSYYDSLNETEGRCGDNGGGFQNSPEADVEQATSKRTNEFAFSFFRGTTNRPTSEGQVCNANFKVLAERGAPGFLNQSATFGPAGYCTDTRQADTPQHAGLQKAFARQQRSYSAGVGVLRCCPPPNFATTRDNALVPGVPEYWSYYASVGAGTTATGAVTPGGTGIYGNEWCAGATTGIVGGFDCDATHWWNPEFGGSAMPKDAQGNDRGGRPGDAYQLRDIDCYDGTLVDGFDGVGLGTTFLGPDGPCPNFV